MTTVAFLLAVAIGATAQTTPAPTTPSQTTSPQSRIPQTSRPQTSGSQTTSPQTTSPPSTNNTGSTGQNQNNASNNFPYSSQGAYNSMDATTLPQGIRSSFDTEYNGVTGAKWEGNNDVYRSSFQRDGKQMSVTYDRNGQVRETRSAMEMTDFPMEVQNSFKGKTASTPSEIKVGNNTYYSAQINGQDMYYDSKGKAVKMTKQPRK